jgi:adenylyl- and sulfurtransferase ThiI
MPHDFRIIDEAVKNYPVYRPLQGLSNSEIMQLALKLGIQGLLIPKISKQRLVSRRHSRVSPAKLEDVRNLEEKLLKVNGMVEASHKSLKTLS